MVNQCVNGCWSFRGHASNCTSCGRPSIATPDPASPFENSPQAQMGSTFGAISHGNPSPANSSPFFMGQTSPAYGSPTMHHDAPAFPLPRPVHDLPATHTSPVSRNAHPPYRQPGYNPRTAIPPVYSATTSIPTIHNRYSPSSASTLNHSSRSVGQSDRLSDTTFEIYDPKADKRAKEKTRSCIPCYRGNRPCRTDKGQICCQSCMGKPKYCRGVIQTPDLVDTQPWFQSTAAFIAGRCRSLDETPEVFDIQVTLNISSQKDEDLLARARVQLPQKYRVDLRRLRRTAVNSENHSQLAGILDMVYSGSTMATEESTRDTLDLETSKCFCRRFVTCLMTLRNFRTCTLNTPFCDESIAPCIMLEFLRQLSNEARYLFRKFFEALNTHLERPRHKQYFTKQLFTLASMLGQIHKALQSFDSALDHVTVPQLDMTALHHLSPVTLEELQNLGGFFNAIGFRAGSQIAPSELTGIHIEVFPPEGRLVDKIAKTQLGETVTFLDVLQRSFCPEIAETTAAADWFETKSPITLEGLSNSVGSPCQDTICVRSPLPLQESPSEEDQFRDILPHERPELDEKCRVTISDLQNILKEEIDRHRAESERHQTRKLELEERISLLSLSLGPDVHTQNNCRAPWPVENENNQPGPMLPGSKPSSVAATLVEHRDDHNSEAHIHTNSGNNEPAQSSPMHPGVTQMTETVIRSPSQVTEVKIQLTMPTTMSHQQIGKRKRFSDYVHSFKKHRVAEAVDTIGSSQAFSTNSKPSVASSKSGSVPNDSKSSDLPFKMRMSRILSPHASLLNKKLPTHNETLHCKDIVPAMSQSNPGSDRPLSWPRSRRWRKSFGVSVKALREGFEKINIDHSEPVPPLPSLI